MKELGLAGTERSGSGGSCCGSTQEGSKTCTGAADRSAPVDAALQRGVTRWVTGEVSTPAGPVPRISSAWSRCDHWGSIRSRSGAFRMRYAVPPGLYAVGTPGRDSEVLVTANYKLSFDSVRRELAGFDAWVLVLDTNSINVWCAAGKGIFGTKELVKRIEASRLDAIVDHRRVILPQLGAVGVNAAEVKRSTGFRVSFGPVAARDIPAYLNAGRKKTPEMSTVKFTLLDRLVLTPMELNPAMKKFPWVIAIILLLFGLQPTGFLFREAWVNGLPFLLLGLLAVFSGALVTPLLLPFVPFRSFAVKGWIIGALTVLVASGFVGLSDGQDAILRIVAYLLFPALSSYLALQFTGATTFTGMSGVKKELRIGIPLYLTAAAASSILMVVFKLREWRVL